MLLLSWLPDFRVRKSLLLFAHVALTTYVKHVVARRLTATLESQAQIPDGIPLDAQQVVEEICRTLRFENIGFEEE